MSPNLLRGRVVLSTSEKSSAAKTWYSSISLLSPCSVTIKKQCTFSLYPHCFIFISIYFWKGNRTQYSKEAHRRTWWVYRNLQAAIYNWLDPSIQWTRSTWDLRFYQVSGRFPKVRTGRPDQSFWQWKMLFSKFFGKTPFPLCMLFGIWLIWLDSFSWLKVKFSLLLEWSGRSVLINGKRPRSLFPYLCFDEVIGENSCWSLLELKRSLLESIPQA